MKLKMFRKLGAVLVVVSAPFVGFSQQQSASDGHLSVSFSKAGNQGYPAADIHPNICLNAQSEYQTTKFTVSIVPPDATAALSIQSGDIGLDKTSAGDGETVTVTGTTIGNYSIKATHSQDNTVIDTTGGTVFEFKFADLVVKESTRNISGSSSSSSLSGDKLSAYTSSNGQYAGGTFERHFELEVVTDLLGAFTHDVIAGAKVDQKYSYDVLLRKGRDERGTSTSVSVSAGVFSYSWGSNGTNACCGYGIDQWVKKHDDQDWTKSNILDQDTDVITWSILDLTPFKTRAYSETDYPISTSDIDRTYTVGSSKFDFKIRVGAVTKSNNVLVSGILADSGAQSANTSHVEAHIPEFRAEDKDNRYEIQP